MLRRLTSTATVVAVLAAVLTAIFAGGPAAAQGPTCAGVPATIVGTPGPDNITGTAGPDVIVTFGSGDTINSGAGDDLVCSGGGDDNVITGPGFDVIYLGPGRDIARAGGGADTVFGGNGGDKLFGGPGWDACFPGRGRDRRVRCESFVEFAANGDLIGAPLGASPRPVIRRLRQVFGPPTDDTGWIEGCPLDGPALNERYLSWGSLTANFYGEGANRAFTNFDYVLRPDGNGDPAPLPGGPLPGDVIMPDGVFFGMTIADVSTATGVQLFFDDVFQNVVVFDNGIEYGTFDFAASAPMTYVAVPFISRCE